MRVLKVALCLLLPIALGAQEENLTYAVMMHPALDSVRVAPARGNEVGWCIGIYFKYRVSTSDLARADTIIRIYTVTRAPTTGADRAGIDFHCPIGTPTVHSHPADDDGRVACDASKIDHRTSYARHEPFSVVWCASPGTVTYRGWKSNDDSTNVSKGPVVLQGGSLSPPVSVPHR